VINELRTKIDNIKEEVTHDMENLRKKNETKIQNGSPFQQNRTNRRQNLVFLNLKMKWQLKEKLKNY
jgi:hypothetical protein